MIRPDMIPDEVVEAALKAWEEDDQSFRPNAKTIAAAINAWPGSYSLAENDSAVIRDVAAIILPLPQEASDE